MEGMTIKCPGCRRSSKVESVEVGTALICPSCDTEFSVHAGGFTSRSGVSAAPAPSGAGSLESMHLTRMASEPVGRSPAVSVQAPEVPVGERLAGRFEVVEMLGKGSFGSVYRAYDEVLDEEVALKVVLRGESGHAQRATEQLLHEYRIRRQIADTSHVIRGEDPRVCDWRNLPLILLPMELAEGGTLRDWLRTERSSQALDKGIRLFREAAMGVGAIHQAGLFHLDLKPENILLTDGRAKISDFGLGRFSLYAHYTDNPDQLLQQGVGTPVYMSPEQFQVARQRDIGPASDIYSLGVVLYEILDGAPPFDGNPDELRQKHLKMDPSPLNGEAGSWWPIVARCLAKDPGQRYPSLDALVADLERKELGTQLLVDVSCPNCGHINRNPAAISCESCRASLEDLFRSCQRCAKELRLDVETCTGCGAAVGAYYLNLERRGRLEELKNTDPVAAIELLETILREGGEKEGDVELLRDLRAHQKQVSELSRRAREAEQAGKYEDAVGLWLECIGIVPRHVKADAEAKRLKVLLSDLKRLEKTARKYADAADFEKATEQVDEALEKAPARSEFKSLKKELARRSTNYMSAIEQARQLMGEKQVAAASTAAKKALSFAPESSEARRMEISALGTVEASERLVQDIQSALDRAEFGEAKAKLDEVESQRSDLEAAKELRTDLKRREKSFRNAMETAEASVREADLTAALRAAKRALGRCPASDQARRLSAEIGDRQERAKQHADEAEVRRKAADFDEALGEASRANGLWAQWPKLATEIASTRKTYEAAMAAVRAAVERADLDAAEREVGKALQECPNAQEAKRAAKDAALTKKRAEGQAERARQLTSEANFEAALKEARQAASAWIQWSELPEEISGVQKTYEEAFSVAEEALARRDLDPAADAAQRALQTCPNSEETRRLRGTVRDLRTQAQSSLEEARLALERADFEQASDSLERARKACASCPDAADIQRRLEEAPKRYHKPVKKAKEYMGAGELDKALEEALKAKRFSPKGPAERILGQIRSLRKQSETYEEQAMSLIKSDRLEQAQEALEKSKEIWKSKSREDIERLLNKSKEGYRIRRLRRSIIYNTLRPFGWMMDLFGKFLTLLFQNWIIVLSVLLALLVITAVFAIITGVINLITFIVGGIWSVLTNIVSWLLALAGL